MSAETLSDIRQHADEMAARTDIPAKQRAFYLYGMYFMCTQLFGSDGYDVQSHILGLADDCK